CVGMRREKRGERLQAELEAVRLILVAAEQENRAAFRRAARRREAADVDRVVEDLPGPGRRSDPLVGGPPAELALVEDVLRLREDLPQRTVERRGAVPGQARIADAVLIHDERDAASPGESEQRAEIPGQPRRPQVEEREVRRTIGKARREPLE